MKLTPTQAAELERLIVQFISIQNEPPPGLSCSLCKRPWLTDGFCCEDASLGLAAPTLKADTRFARQSQLVPAALAVLKEASNDAAREDDQRFIARLAGSLLPWESAGDDAAAALAVRAARQLVAAARRDTQPLSEVS